MSAQRQLNRLAARKLELRARIAERRAALALAAHDFKAPLALADRGLALLRAVPAPVKWAAAPAALFAAKKLGGAAGLVKLVRYAPLAVRAIALARARFGAARPAPTSPAA